MVTNGETGVNITGVFSGNGSGLTSLPASNLTGALPTISGASLTALNASQLTSGTIPQAQLPSTIAFLNSNQTFTGQNNFSSSVGIGTTSPTSPLDVYSANVNGAAITLNSGGFFSLIEQKSFNSPDHGLQFWNNSAANTDQAFIFLNAPATSLLTMLANGNIGIGTTTPGAPLSLGSSLANTKLALFDSGSSFFGLGIQTAQFRLHTSSSNDRFSFLNAPNGENR